MARREGISAIVDINESVKQLENELRILTTNKQALSANVSELVTERDGLLKEVSELKEKVKKVLGDADKESQRLIDIESEKVKKANLKEGELSEKQSVLDSKIKDANNLIKSNEGLKRNLDLQITEAKAKLSKIDSFVELLKTNLNTIK